MSETEQDKETSIPAAIDIEKLVDVKEQFIKTS